MNKQNKTVVKIHEKFNLNTCLEMKQQIINQINSCYFHTHHVSVAI